MPVEDPASVELNQPGNHCWRTTMKKLSRIVCRTAVGLLSIVALQGCETIDTGSHYDETNNFGDYRSFSWIDDTPYIAGGGRSEVRVSPLTQTKIERAIRAELESK